MIKADNPNEAFVMKFFEVLSTGDLETLRPMVHPEATWTPMGQNIPGAGVHHGRKGIVDEFLGPVRGLFEPGEPKVTVTSLTSKGDMVVAECRGVGTLKNGKAYDNLYCWVYELKDGMMFALREYMDTAYIQSLMS